MTPDVGVLWVGDILSSRDESNAMTQSNAAEVQMISYFSASTKGTDVDLPKKVAKPVTVA